VPEGDYSVAVTSTGAVYAWGANAEGQLGNNSTTDSRVPVLAMMPTGAIAVAVGAGPNFAHVLTTDGNIYYWGAGGSGSTQHLTPVPTALPPEKHAIAVSAGPDGEQMAAVFVPDAP
jgi:alpha-tubulin suppressor-like RCC1 family protein